MSKLHKAKCNGASARHFQGNILLYAHMCNQDVQSKQNSLSNQEATQVADFLRETEMSQNVAQKILHYTENQADNGKRHCSRVSACIVRAACQTIYLQWPNDGVDSKCSFTKSKSTTSLVIEMNNSSLLCSNIPQTLG